MQKMSDEIETTQNELKALTQALVNEETAKQAAAQKKQTLTQKLKKSEAKLQEDIQRLQGEAEELSDQKIIKQKEIAFIKKQIEDFHADKVACINEGSVLAQELQNIQSELTKDEAKLEQINDMLTRQEQENALYEKELDTKALNVSGDSLLSIGSEDDETQLQQRIAKLQHEKLRLDNEQEKLVFVLKDLQVRRKIKESRVSTLKAEISRFSITTRKEFAELTNNPTVLKEQLEQLEAEHKDLRGEQIVEQLQALKHRLEKQINENAALRTQLITKQELKLKGESLPGPLQTKCCNCTLQ